MSEPTLHSIRVAPRSPSERPPLLLLLHGYGADEHDLVELAARLDPRFVVRSVQAPLTLGFGGRAWFSLGLAPDGSRLVDEDEAEAARLKLTAFIDEVVAAEEADPRRVYLVGFSQGGMMALSVALLTPERVAGVVAMSSRLLPRFYAARAPAQQLAGLPVLVVHGTEDPMVPYASGRRARDQLEQAGLSVAWHEYPMGHEITQASLDTVARWLTARLE